MLYIYDDDDVSNTDNDNKSQLHRLNWSLSQKCLFYKQATLTDFCLCMNREPYPFKCIFKYLLDGSKKKKKTDRFMKKE